MKLNELNDFDFSEELVFDDDDDFYRNFGVLYYNDDDIVDEAEYQGRKVKLGKPMAGDVKKFKVYVKNPKGNVVKVNFGQKGTKIKKSNPARRRSFRARHNCDNPGPRHKARYWSCRKW
tara:strand:+ start:73 stop:429 length:357 start_codon:yes stop_codon:yes gene_type:complete